MVILFWSFPLPCKILKIITMQISHVVSDLVLAAAGAYAFFRYFSRLELRLALLWGVFLIPVSLAALFGALRFAGVHGSMVDISSFFQVVATILGSSGLMLGGFGLIAKDRLQTWSVVVFLVGGFFLWAMVAMFEVNSVRNLMPMIAMACLIVFGMAAFWLGRKKTGLFLLLGVGLSAMAVWAIGSLSNQTLRIDVYHFLLAASLISFAMAAKFRLVDRPTE